MSACTRAFAGSKLGAPKTSQQLGTAAGGHAYRTNLEGRGLSPARPCLSTLYRCWGDRASKITEARSSASHFRERCDLSLNEEHLLLCTDIVHHTCVSLASIRHAECEGSCSFLLLALSEIGSMQARLISFVSNHRREGIGP